MAEKNQGCGCGTIILGLVLIGSIIDWDLDLPPEVEVETYEGRSPRRPAPGQRDEYIIKDPGKPQDSQGTAFVVDRDGVWLTAEHVTHGCDYLGVDTGDDVQWSNRVLESRESDAALIRDGPLSDLALPISTRLPRRGEQAYHMGFPASKPAIVISRFIGSADARRGGLSNREPIYVWAEQGRVPASKGSLGGISGGPTISQAGNVIGINSASTERRGRVLTTDPRAVRRLVRASGDVDERPSPKPLRNAQDAERRFQQYLEGGQIRQVYCDVR